MLVALGGIITMEIIISIVVMTLIMLDMISARRPLRTDKRIILLLV
jgi:hypothetical protein